MTPRPKNSTKERALENRQRILEAAEAAFADKGFDGANMREIAHAAGVNKFMLYYHFDNKETLFEQVLQTFFRPVFQRLHAILEQPISLEETLSQVYDLYAGLFKQKGERLRAFMAREIASGAPHFQPLVKSVAPQVLAVWEPKLIQYLGVEHLSDKQLRLMVASIMIGIISYFVMQPIFWEIMKTAGINEDDRKQHVIPFILGGVRAGKTEFNP